MDLLHVRRVGGSWNIVRRALKKCFRVTEKIEVRPFLLYNGEILHTPAVAKEKRPMLSMCPLHQNKPATGEASMRTREPFGSLSTE
jgi:hypothetical protein